MRFTTLEIENFLAITAANLRLDDRGLCLIQGENLDDTSATSNGSGKSSLADALCWVLYGETARGVTGDAVINDKAGKGTMVQIDVDDEGEVYRIARHRKHVKHKNSLTVLHLAKNGTMTDLTKGTDRLTQEVVDKIVGASLDVFRAAVYAGQEQMPDLPAMTDKHLKMLIEEASGVTLLEDAYREARDRLQTAKNACDMVTGKIDTARRQKEFIEDQVITTTASRDAWTLDHQLRLVMVKTEIGGRVTKVKELDLDLADIDVKEITDGLAECDRKLGVLGSERKEHGDLQKKVSNAEAAANSLRQGLLAIKKRHEAAKEARDNAQHKIGCPCDECGRPLTAAEMRDVIAAASKKLSDLSQEFADAKKLLEQAAKSTGELTSALQAFEASMTDPSAISAQRASLQSRSDAHQRLIRERELEVTKARALGDEAKRLAASINPHDKALTNLNDKLTQAGNAITALCDELKSKETELGISESVVKVFSPAGVRAHILDEVTPFLNQQTSKYLETMSDGNIEATWATLVKNAKGELREKFSIEVVNDKGAKSFAGLSGGEKRKVRISTALALQDLVATRATKPIDLFIGDEIDDALDTAGLERLTQILDEKAKERGSVFVISHSDIRDWISQVITVQKKDGETTLIEQVV